MLIQDNRLFHCKYCGDKQNFDVNSETGKGAAEFWDEYHRYCKERIEEIAIVEAMRAKNKSLFEFEHGDY